MRKFIKGSSREHPVVGHNYFLNIIYQNGEHWDTKGQLTDIVQEFDTIAPRVMVVRTKDTDYIVDILY